MIAKKVPMNNPRKSSFTGLVEYLTNPQNHNERVEGVKITNCNSNNIEWAQYEILATQEQNQRSTTDKAYHLIVSFHPSEKVDQEILHKIEAEICEGLGYADHQRISVIHNDTDHLHFHIAINKIHPETFNSIEPYRDYQKLGSLCTSIEEKYNLEKTNHVNQDVKKVDFEHKSGIESLITYIRRECESDITNATTWQDLQNNLAIKNIEVKAKGAGLVFADKESNLEVKLSSINREYSKSKLEARLGPFSKPESNQKVKAKTKYKEEPLIKTPESKRLYQDYQAEQQLMNEAKQQDLKGITSWRNGAIKDIHSSYNLKRRLLKFADNGMSKRITYALLNKQMQKEIAKITQVAMIKRQEVYKQNKGYAWQNWLQQEAKKGNQEALKLLRARKPTEASRFINHITGNPASSYDKPADHITTSGTLFFNAGKQVIRDDGKRINVPDNPSYKALEQSLKIAVQKYGNVLNVQGSDVFKRRLAQVAAQSNLNIKFDDVALEKLKTQMKGRTDARARTGSINESRANTRGATAGINGGLTAGARTTTIHGALNAVRSMERKGLIPPANRRMRLLGVSELPLVFDPQRPAMLLPQNVPNNLDKQKTEGRDRSVRRGEHGGHVTLNSIDKYIHERNEKRKSIIDIAEHIRYNVSDISDVLVFKGLRNVDDQTVVLLAKKDDPKVYVMQITDYQIKRLKTLKIGSEIIVNKNGLRQKGKGRT